jgi:hypothetical protein
MPDHVGDSPTGIAPNTHATRGRVNVPEKVFVAEDVNSRLVIKENPRFGERTVNVGKLKRILDGEVFNSL